jgi:SAM-dependent methyltransferase
MKEASKSMFRRMHDIRFANRYFSGEGIDIGCGTDPVSLYREFFPKMGQVRCWDLQDGDAQYLHSIPNEHFDFVHSSHCLEHMVDPRVALHHWFRVLKPGGHLVCVVPDEDLYEQGIFPSTFNADHKWTFTTFKQRSWSELSVNLFDLIGTLGLAAEPLKVELLDATFRYDLPRFDQTLTPVGESAIEFVIRKRLVTEIEAGGRLPNNADLMTAEEFHSLTGIPIR